DSVRPKRVWGGCERGDALMAGSRQPGYDNDDDDYGYGNNRNDLLDIIPERFSDEPTAEEEPQKGRGLLMGTALVGIAVAGAAAWFLFSGSSSPTVPQTGGVPTITADGTAYKVKPEEPGGMQVPNQDKQVYQRLNPNEAAAPQAASSMEKLLPDPGQPKAPPPPGSAEALAPPPAPTLDANAGSVSGIRPPSVLGTTPVAPTAAPAAVPSPVPTQQASVATTPPAALAAPTVAPAPAPAPVKAPAAPKPPPAVAPAPAPVPAFTPPSTPAAPAVATGVPSGSGTGPFTIQLAALRDEATARKTWQQMQQKYPALLGSLSLVVEKSDQGQKGVFYRVRGTGIPSEERARYVCAELSKDKVGCLFVGK
ncbi:MAG: SPOR domain-containing protein, partial [Saprospiraceae bacterium]